MVVAPQDVVIVDDVLPDPFTYRAACLAQSFGSVTLGAQTFHGIAEPPNDRLRAMLAARYPWFDPRLSFLRLSPFGQLEPNLVHDDRLMGQWTAILYLNPVPPVGDGTVIGDRMVAAQFNRLTVFPAMLPHTRALVNNYGDSPETARLIQVCFGGEPLWP